MTPRLPFGFLVNSSAQFRSDNFPNSQLIRVFPEQSTGKDNSVFYSILDAALTEFDELVLLHSDPRLTNNQHQIDEIKGDTKYIGRVIAISSSAFGPGLGNIVQNAAEKSGNIATGEIISLIRELNQKTYSGIIFPKDSSQFQALLQKTDSAPVKSSALFNIVSIDNETISLLGIVKNQRYILDELLEFASEFDHLSSLSLMQSRTPVISDSRAFHAAFAEAYPKISFFEHKANETNNRLLGDSFISLTISTY